MTELALVVILYTAFNYVIVGRALMEPAYLTPRLNWR